MPVPSVLRLEPAKPVEGQHIFPDDELHQYALKWKEYNAKGKHAQAMLLLDKIVRGSTPMFERLAQHEKFHHTVDLEILVSAAQEKVVKWLLRWEPKLGKLFTFFSKCARHAMLSELVKVNTYRKRYHATSDSLEKFIGTEDHSVDKHDLAHEVRRALDGLTCRWGDPQEQGALRYLIDCIMDEDNRNRQWAIRGAAYTWGISIEMAKFFYRWALSSLRSLFMDKIRINFTEQDLLLLCDSYTDFVDLLNDIPWQYLRVAMIKHGGKRIKIPTLNYLLGLKENYTIWKEIEATPKDPASIAEVAERHNKTSKNATETYKEMCEKLNPQRAGEYYLYRSNEDDDAHEQHLEHA